MHYAYTVFLCLMFCAGGSAERCSDAKAPAGSDMNAAKWLAVGEDVQHAILFRRFQPPSLLSLFGVPAWSYHTGFQSSIRAGLRYISMRAESAGHVSWRERGWRRLTSTGLPALSRLLYS